MALQHLRSGVANKRPIPTIMSEGQIALNTNEASPGLFFKDSNGDLVKIGPVHIGTSAPNSSPASTAATALVTGATYQILTVGTSDFTLVGASANTVGTIFTATGTTTGTGTVSGQQGVEKGEQWLDTTGGNYVLKIYDGTAWRSEAGEFVNVSGDTMTGALLLDNAASVSAPDLSFDGDANTGIYSPGADQFGVATGGTAALTIDASQRVGIGTTSPEDPLHIKSNSGAIRLENTVVSNNDSTITYNNTDLAFHVDPNNVRGSSNITFSGDGNERMRIDSSGNVGIGTTSPGNNLDIAVSANSEGINIGGSGNFFGLIQYDANRSGADQAIGDIAFKWNGTRVARIIGGTGTDTTNKDDGVLQFHTASAGSATEKMRIDSSGNVGIGRTPFTSPAGYPLQLRGGSQVFLQMSTSGHGDTATDGLSIGADGSSAYITQRENAPIAISTNNIERMRIDSSGNLLLKQESASSPYPEQKLKWSNDSTTTNGFYISQDTSRNGRVWHEQGLEILFGTNNTERMRIDSSGRLLVGTSTPVTTGVGTPVQIAQDNAGSIIALARNDTSVVSDQTLGRIEFYGNDSSGTYELCAFVAAEADLDHATGDKPTRLVFSTTADGASSPTERMRITSGNFVNIGTQGTDIIWNQTAVKGVTLGADGVIQAARNADQLMLLNRIGTDGVLVTFAHDGIVEGDIGVNGTTVSYNGAHLARWSQLPGGAERSEILRGSVLSNLDEMCEWGEEDNEQLNRMQVSNVEGDCNVAGVFQAWDDDDDTYTNDFYCAMTGDFVIRIAQGTTVARGDLLMSAGDGTAKPQDDDIVRSKTIAKVTSTVVSETYADGSYCVPCVLMAC